MKIDHEIGKRIPAILMGTCVVVVAMTTFNLKYYYSHHEQKRLRNLIKGKLKLH